MEHKCLITESTTTNKHVIFYIISAPYSTKHITGNGIMDTTSTYTLKSVYTYSLLKLQASQRCEGHFLQNLNPVRPWQGTWESAESELGTRQRSFLEQKDIRYVNYGNIVHWLQYDFLKIYLRKMHALLLCSWVELNGHFSLFKLSRHHGYYMNGV